MDSGLQTLLGAMLVAWLFGYATGVTFRLVRQIFEKSTRG